MSEGRTNLLIIEDAVIARIARDPRFLAEFPFLSGISQDVVKSGCGACARKKRNALMASYNNIKQILGTMDAAKKVTLKNLLNTSQVRVKYKSNDGNIIQATF